MRGLRMPDVECFWVDRTDRAQRWLRRWVSATAAVVEPATIAALGIAVPACSNGQMYHSASVYAGDSDLLLSEHDGRMAIASLDPAEYTDDPRWPTSCEICSWAFPAIVRWDGISRFDGTVNLQVMQEPIYGAADGRGEYAERSLPPGAMFDADWHHGHWMGSDGISLTVVCPHTGDARNGFWIVDGPAGNAPGVIPAWTRTGDPRMPGSVSAMPSIQTGTYHGWLREGKLVDA